MAYASGCSVKVHLTRMAYQSNEQEYSKQIRKTLSKTRQRLPGQRFVKHFRTYFLHRAPGESVTKFTTPSIACCCVSRSLSERFCCCRPLPRLLPLAVPLALFQSLALLLLPADLIAGPSAETGMVSSDRHRGVGEARGGSTAGVSFQDPRYLVRRLHSRDLSHSLPHTDITDFPFALVGCKD